MPPAYVVQHTYLGAGPEIHHHRPVVMLANRIEDNNTEADCSGRALATLVVAWVGAALVASVLLKWTQLWIALVVLTLLFFAACGYAAYDARKTHTRALALEEARQLERRQRRERHLESSVSAGIDNFPEIIDAPEYQTYWVADLPPSYTAAMDLESPGNPAHVTNGEQQTGHPRPENAEEELPAVDPPRLSNPPPYAIAIQSEPLFLPLHSVGNITGGERPQQPPAIPDQNSIGGGQPTIPLNGDHLSNSRRVLQVSNQSNTRDEDKIEEGPDRSVSENAGGNNPSPPRRTQYLTSIINSTFGRRNAHRTNNQQSHQMQPQANSNSAGVTITAPTNSDYRQNEQQNNRNREQNLIVNNSTNNDRNIDNNCSSVPAQTSPFPTELSGSFSNC